MEPPNGQSADPDAGAASPAAGDADTDLDALPVKLSFEIGNAELALSDLRAMTAGHVIDLRQDPADAVDILANGRRIGRGEVVQIGESLGVQVVRLFGHG